MGMASDTFAFFFFHFRQFAAVQSPSGIVRYSVGFAKKNLRQVGTPTVPSGPKTTYIPDPSSGSTSSPGVQTIHSLPTLGLMAVSMAVATFLW